MDAFSAPLAPCLVCGALVPDIDGPVHKYVPSSPGCWRTFGDVQADEMMRFRHPPAHRIVADAYMAQHPGDASDRRDRQSVFFHLVGLCAVFVLGMPPARATGMFRRLLRDRDDFPHLRRTEGSRLAHRHARRRRARPRRLRHARTRVGASRVGELAAAPPAAPSGTRPGSNVIGYPRSSRERAEIGYETAGEYTPGVEPAPWRFPARKNRGATASRFRSTMRLSLPYRPWESRAGVVPVWSGILAVRLIRFTGSFSSSGRASPAASRRSITPSARQRRSPRPTSVWAPSSRRSSFSSPGHEASDELAQDIADFVRTWLSQYAYPRRIEFVDELPKTLIGKIRRIELREREHAAKASTEYERHRLPRRNRRQVQAPVPTEWTMGANLRCFHMSIGTGVDWRDRQVSAAEAVSVVRAGDRVFVGSACATPRTLVEALEKLSRPGVALVHFLTDGVGTGDPPHTNYRHRVFYVGSDVRALGSVRALREAGQVEYVPLSLADVPQLFHQQRIPLDVALVQVAPPDTDGTCSLGISVDVTKAAALAARTVIAEVNPAMPRTAGDSRIPVERVASFVPVETPVVEYIHEPAGEVAEQIARYAARLIDDGATLQVGLGRVPNEMLARLTNRRELTIHSDVITEPIVDLVAEGVVTGPVSASWAMGSRRLYDLVDDNPRFTFHPIEYICDPAVISSKERMVSVTQAFTVDLTGQVCMDSVDGELYGGVSTGPAFHRGALSSPGGVAIVCLASRTPAGRSAIRLDLDPDEAVAIPRADVHWVITEYGTAYLFGHSLAERAVALIEIAHPDDRKALLDAAIERGLFGPRQQLRSRAAYPVTEVRDVRLRDGREVHLRPTRTSDTRAMQDLFYRLSDEDRETRFLHKLNSLTDTTAQYLCSVSYEDEMAFAAVIGPPAHERIVAASCYYLNPATGLAEVAYMVDPEWQGSGLGGILHAGLVDHGRKHGARGLSADVLFGNTRMMRVFQKGDYSLSVKAHGGVEELTMLFN
jgi:acyl-CoA hydrolase/RimJ/RimL family protein N-acetyltransferase